MTHRSLYRPFSDPQPRIQGAVAHALDTCPICNGVSLALELDQFAVAPVIGLDLPRCPSAIFWTVRPIIVDSIKRSAARAVAHVGSECGEVLPTLTHDNSAPAIVLEGWIGRAATATPHVIPNYVKRASGSTVLGESDSRIFAPVTAAGPDFPAAQVVSRDRNNPTTVASANPPITVTNNFVSFAFNNEATETLANKVQFATGCHSACYDHRGDM